MNEYFPDDPDAEFVVLPGGRLPEYKSDDAAGYDMYARAVVSQTEQDEYDPRLRKTLFDFHNVPDSAWLQEHIVYDPDDETKWAYVLRPGECALIGVGVVTKLQKKMFYWLSPRSGLSMKGLTLANAPGTVDADYRGEAGALLLNVSEQDFVVQHQMRIAQAIFSEYTRVNVVVRETIDDLGKTERDGGGFGSTGLHG